MKRITVLLLLLLLSVALCNPGGKLIVKQSLFDDVSKYAVNYIVDTIMSTNIPSISVTEEASVVGKVDINIKDIKMKRASLDKSILSINNDGIHFDCYGFSGVLTGNYKYRQQRWPHTDGSGSFEASWSSSSVSIIAHLTAGNDKDGHPTVSMNGKVSLNNFNLQLHGTVADWLANLFVKVLKPTIVRSTQDGIASSISQIGPVVTSQIAAYPIPMPLNVSQLALDWSVSSIIMDPPVWRTESKVMVQYNNITYTVDPAVLPDSIGTQEVQIVLSKATVQSLLHSVYISETAQYSVDVMTKDFKLVVPEMVTQYPNNLMTVTFKPATEPMIDILDNRVIMRDAIVATSSIHVPDSDDVFGFTFNGTLFVNVTGSFKGNLSDTLTGNVDALQFKLDTASSPFGKVNWSMLNIVIKYIMPKLQQTVNAQLASGYKLPTLTLLEEYLVPMNGTLTLDAQCVGIGLDVEARQAPRPPRDDVIN